MVVSKVQKTVGGGDIDLECYEQSQLFSSQGQVRSVLPFDFNSLTHVFCSPKHKMAKLSSVFP